MESNKRGCPRRMKPTILFLALATLVLVPFTIPSCYTLNSFDKEIGSSGDLIKLTFAEEYYIAEESQWSASGGAVLFIGGFSAGGKSTTSMKYYNQVLFAPQLKDGSIVLLKGSIDNIRIRYGSSPTYQFIFKEGMATTPKERGALTTTEVIYKFVKEVILTVPRDSGMDFIKKVK